MATSLYCHQCKKYTAHKRMVGMGTFIAILATMGFWLLAIPFYPKRCYACGTKMGFNPDEHDPSSVGRDGL